MTDLRRLHEQEEGVALVLVIGTTLVLFLLSMALIAFAFGGFQQSTRDTRWVAALDAAEAGVQDYLFRLNNNDEYWRFDLNNPPPDGNQAFGDFNPDPPIENWVPIAGSDNPGQFTYSIDRTLIGQGTVALTSRGRVGGVEREVEVQIRRQSFLDYLYFTDFETSHPSMQPDSVANPGACAAYAYAWNGSPARPSDCVNIVFFGDGEQQTTDVIDGPLHTNDTMRIFGQPVFVGDTTSSRPDPDDFNPDQCQPRRWLGSGSPRFPQGDECYPVLAPQVRMPPSNQALASHTDPGLGETGCRFSGPTKIQLRSDGMMQVWSPGTESGGNCEQVNGEVTALPANGVIFVEDLPDGQGCTTHPFADDLDNEDVTVYDCNAGDVFVWGDLAGRVTIRAQNNINIVWHLTYVDDGLDMLGLIADGWVQTYHPVNSSGGNLPVRFHDPSNTTPFMDAQVNAALLSVNRSIRVQHHNRGAPLGVLTVNGALAQRFRGPVGTLTGPSWNRSIGTGYAKDYNYDARLAFQSPPNFINPVDAQWMVSTWKE